MALLDTMGLKRCPGTILPLGEGLCVRGVPVFSTVALQSVPDNVYILAHVPSRYSLKGFRVITVIRDPRAVLVSYCRHRRREDDLDVSIAQAIQDFWGAPFAETYTGYLGWHGRCVWLRYEDLDPNTIGEGKGIYPAGTDFNTRTGSPSRWQDWWDDEAEAAWVAHGGPALLADAGYPLMSQTRIFDRVPSK